MGKRLIAGKEHVEPVGFGCLQKLAVLKASAMHGQGSRRATLSRARLPSLRVGKLDQPLDLRGG